MRTYLFIILNVIFLSSLRAQIGGEATYQFLDLPPSARSSSLSGSSIGLWDHDLNLALSNPSLLDSSMHKSLILNYADYIADINYGTAGYAHYMEGKGIFAFAINYMHYGRFKEADETGQVIGQFTASDYAFNMLYSKPLSPKFQIGANLKFLYSNYYQYFSLGLALDAGITYHNDDKNHSLALVIKHFGHQIKPYRQGNYENLPFDMQLAFAQKLNHAPFRLLVALHHLHNWSMAYDSPLDEKSTVLGEEAEEIKKSTFDKVGDEFIRHLNVGAEIVPSKNVYIRIGYDFQKMKEMIIDQKFGMVGFSVGAGIRIYKFHVSYARSVFHVAGATNTFSISSNLQEFF